MKKYKYTPCLFFNPLTLLTGSVMPHCDATGAMYM